MKRKLIATLIIGAITAVIISALQLKGLLFRAEFGITEFVSLFGTLTKSLGTNLQYVLVAVFSFGVAWMTLASKRRSWAIWLFIILLLEVAAAAWVFALYQILFQPLPSILAAAMSFALALSYRTIGGGARERLASEMFSHHLSQEQLERVVGGGLPLESQATVHEASAVMCDIAQKYDLAEEVSPEALARMVDKFVRFATGIFLEEGAYLHAADGEGVVAIFGFPVEDAGHAEKAASAALRMVRAYQELQKAGKDSFDRVDVHVGISSGSIIAARFQDGDAIEVVPIGEPLELSRRFAIANRAYGSRILLGPETFQLAEKAIVARPIDFLVTGGQDRLEIYELLSLAAGATPEEMARRDNFWSGVVYYREKRWGEAYAEFQKAFADNGAEDAPLQFYLRRLEPLVLELTEPPSPSDVPPAI